MKLYNSQSKELEEFIPQDPNNVQMYVCGPTVYSTPHVGNARPAIVFDVLFHILKQHFPNVTYASNFTDIDDKIIERARTLGVPTSEVTAKAVEEYERDMWALNNVRPTIRMYATEYIDKMVQMIQTLIDREFAYVVDGEVLFYVPSNTHPKLVDNSGFEATGRIEQNTKKRSPQDFVLWKPAKPGEPSWESPWGRGRPGWHIECSAMIAHRLGETIDIHGGGQDLLFPHHDAENAQSSCAHGKPLAKYWVHNGLITSGAGKMAKSIGNVVYLQDLLSKYKGESVRFFFLKTHYRSPLEWSEEGLKQAEEQLDSYYRILWKYRDAYVHLNVDPDPKFMEYLDNDMNVPGALARLHEMMEELNKGNVDIEQAYSVIIKSTGIIGILRDRPENWFHDGVNSTDIEKLISERNSARANKDWARSDALRNELNEMNVVVEDGNNETFWRVVRS